MKTHVKSSEDFVRLEAFLLSENAGHPHGMDAIFWAQAEEIVQARLAGTIKAKTPAKTKASVVKAPTMKAAPAVKTSAKGKQPEKTAAATAKAVTVERPVAPKVTTAKKAGTTTAKSAPKRKGNGGKTSGTA